MKKIILFFLIFCQIKPAFSYDESYFIKKFESLNTTFSLQSTNFFSEVNKMNKLAENPKADSNHFQMLYVTSAQSLCITVLTLEKTKNLIEENPQVVGHVLTKDHVDEINYKVNVFKKYLKEFDLDDQGCKDMLPSTYDSIMNS